VKLDRVLLVLHHDAIGKAKLAIMNTYPIHNHRR
jgi:hypothetical protein